MKKTIIAVMVLGVLALGTVAYAHMWGGGQGWGGHMWGGGPGWGYQGEESKKFLDETAGLRKDLNDKTFQYREAWRAGDEKKAEALEKEISELQGKLYDKAKESGYFTGRGYGWGPGMMWGGNHPCGGPYTR